jgi:hypothetical protein
MHYDFTEDWHGWKLRGGFLVSPDRQHLTRERLEGLLWRDAQELRLAGLRSRREAMKPRQLVKVVVIDLAELRDGRPRAG